SCLDHCCVDVLDSTRHHAAVEHVVPVIEPGPVGQLLRVPCRDVHAVEVAREVSWRITAPEEVLRSLSSTLNDGFRRESLGDADPKFLENGRCQVGCLFICRRSRSAGKYAQCRRIETFSEGLGGSVDQRLAPPTCGPIDGGLGERIEY